MSERSAASLPDGEYAIVEVLGHRTLIGRVAEVERFGAKLCQIEPIFRGQLLAGVLVGGGSIYQFTPCSREQAFDSQPTSEWQLPESVRSTVAPALLTNEADAMLARGYGDGVLSEEAEVGLRKFEPVETLDFNSLGEVGPHLVAAGFVEVTDVEEVRLARLTTLGRQALNDLIPF